MTEMTIEEERRNLAEVRKQFRERTEEMRRSMLTMTLERERLLSFFKMAVDAMQTVRSRAQLGNEDWIVEIEVMSHMQSVLNRVRDIADGKAKP